MDSPYTRIACCIDRDEMTHHVLREALALAGPGGSIQVVHVVAPPHALVAGPFTYLAPIAEAREEAEAWVADIADDIPGATPVVLDGTPARRLCEWARDTGVDLIVAAAHRGLVERAMLGGFASHIAYHAPCSVLLVHRPVQEAQTAAAAREETDAG